MNRPSAFLGFLAIVLFAFFVGYSQGSGYAMSYILDHCLITFHGVMSCS